MLLTAKDAEDFAYFYGYKLLGMNFKNNTF